jgi:hypothetical protein
VNPVFEAVGYIASGFIVVSLIQKSILRLRLVGLAGSLSFIAYGFLIDALPIVAVNVLTASIHVWFLRKLTLRTGDVFEILHVAPESRYLAAFLRHHSEDIGRYQPEFSIEPSRHDLTAFVLRDLVPAGLLIGTRRVDGSVDLDLDYAIPAYRDFRMGRWVFSDESGLFSDRDGHIVRATATTDAHASYLRRMGFAQVDDGLFEVTVGAVP